MKPSAIMSCLFASLGVAVAADKPNIIYILTDDLGYGDVSILNPERGKIPTPNLDQFAKDGMIFTDAHSNSSVCTPTRYGILTGRYAWRALQKGVLNGDSKHLIAEDRMTVASFLRTQGYQTACIGKWHLGMDMAAAGSGKGKEIDYTKPIANGPTAVGFDYYYGITASLDMPPYVYIENDRFTSVPTAMAPKPPSKQGHYRSGPIADGFVFEEVLPTLTDKASAYIHDHAKQEKPFFLYFTMTGPHTPILPTKEFKGKTKLGDYGDFCVEVDAMVGKILEAVTAAGIGENTWIVFTSDNGCSKAADFDHLESLGHYPSAQFRGMKADVYDGGHRVPFLMRWPGHIAAGSRSSEIICHTDFLATCADLLGQRLPDNAGEDSVSILPAMLGKPHNGPLREAVVHHSIQGAFSIRQGNWKLELCPGSGGWSDPKPGSKEEQGLPPTQLYDLSADIAEQHNMAAENPEVVQRLTELLKKYADDGRSTPGTPQKNDTAVDIFRGQKIKNGGVETE